MLKRVIAGCLLVLLAACGGDKTVGPKPTAEPAVRASCPMAASDAVVVTEAESGGTFAVGKGQGVVVSLAANGSTGYSWSYRAAPEGVLVENKSEYISDRPVIPGSGGRQCVRFIAAQQGTVRLAFEYRRPWETGAAPSETAQFDVTVR